MDMLDALNIGSSLVPMVSNLYQGYQLRHDDLLNEVARQGIERYNDILNRNPYGDPLSGWGGMFGYNADGTPVGFGQAQAGALNQMLGYGGGNQALQNYAALAGAQGPVLSDATAGLRALMGYDGTPQGYQTGMPIQPGYQNPQAGTQFSGSQGNAGYPQGQNPYQLDPALAEPRFGWLDRVMDGSWQNAGPQAPSPAQQYSPGGFTGRPGSGMGNMGSGFRGSTNGQMPYRKDLPQDSAAGFQQAPRGGPRVPAAQTSGVSTRLPMGGRQPNAQQPTQTPVQQNPVGATTGGQSMSAAPNAYQQLLQSPMAYTPQFQQQLYDQGKANIDLESQALQRQMRTQAGQAGAMDTGAFRQAQYQAGQDRLGALRQLQTDIGTRAAETNFGNLLSSAGLQGQMEQALAGLGLQQNQQRLGAYQQGVENTGRIIDQMYNIGQGSQQQQMALWDRIAALGRQGMQLPMDYLSQIEQRRFNQLAPVSAVAGPTYLGNQATGASESSGLGQAIGQGVGYMMANYSPWSN